MRKLFSLLLCIAIPYLFLPMALLATAGEMEGQTLTTARDSYTLQQSLGAGVFGEVYKAQNEAGDLFAIKVFHDCLNIDPLAITNEWPSLELKNDTRHIIDPQQIAEREWQNGQMLDHPQIIKLVDRGNLAGQIASERPFLVMEFVNGHTISSQPEGSFTNQEALLLTWQYLQTVHYIIDRGHYYADMHPGNVMIDDDKQVKIIDMGGIFAMPPLPKNDAAGNNNTINAYLKRLYWIARDTLKKGQYTAIELKEITDQLKSFVPLAGDQKLSSTNSSSLLFILDKWEELLLNQIKAERDQTKAA